MSKTLNEVSNLIIWVEALAWRCNTVQYRPCGQTKHLSVFSPNAGKYGPEITPYLDTFQAVLRLINTCLYRWISQDVDIMRRCINDILLLALLNGVNR